MAYRTQFKEPRDIIVETRNGETLFQDVRQMTESEGSLRLYGVGVDGGEVIISAFHIWNGWWFFKEEE